MTVSNQALGLAILLLAGYLGGRAARSLKLPMVTGYVLAGLLLGPSVLNLVTTDLNNDFNLIKVLGLGLIALMLGGELEIKRIKQLGKSILGITFVQITATSIIVFLAMYYILRLPLPIALLLGAMATATAPATPVAVIREYKAKGTFTSTLMGVVAADDAVCIILFGLVASLVRMLLDGAFYWGAQLFIEPARELFFSFSVGALTGLLLVLLLRYIPDRQHKIVLFVGVALLNSGISYFLHGSPLLTNMTTGFVFANLSSRPQTLSVLNDIDFPIFVVFFTLAGASLHLDVLAANWLPALVYILARATGKIGGGFLGARVSGAPENVQKYLGFSMLSKAGVTIGLVLLVQGRFPEIAMVITAIELAAVTVFEFIGPLGVKYALVSSGEAADVPGAKSPVPTPLES